MSLLASLFEQKKVERPFAISNKQNIGGLRVWHNLQMLFRQLMSNMITDNIMFKLLSLSCNFCRIYLQIQ